MINKLYHVSPLLSIAFKKGVQLKLYALITVFLSDEHNLMSRVVEIGSGIYAYAVDTY